MKFGATTSHTFPIVPTFSRVKIQQYITTYLSLPPYANVIKYFTMVICCHPNVILFINDGVAINNHNKKFYNIGPRSHSDLKGHHGKRIK